MDSEESASDQRIPVVSTEKRRKLKKMRKIRDIELIIGQAA